MAEWSFECVWTTELPAKAGRFATSPDGALLAVPVRDRSIRLLSPRDGSALARQPDAHAGGEAIAAAWSADGCHLATAAYPGEVIVWRRDLQCVSVLAGFPREVNTVAFAGNRRLIAATEDTLTAIAWRDGGERHTAGVGANHFAVTGDGGVLTGDERGVVRLLGPRFTVRREWVAHCAPVCQVALLPGGDFVTAGKDHAIARWGPGEQQRWRRVLPGQVLALAVAPDGGMLAARSRDDRFHLLDCSTGAVLHSHQEIATDQGWCVGLQFLRDQADPWLLLGLCGHDRAVRLWRVHCAQAAGEPACGRWWA